MRRVRRLMLGSVLLWACASPDGEREPAYEMEESPSTSLDAGQTTLDASVADTSAPLTDAAITSVLVRDDGMLALLRAATRPGGALRLSQVGLYADMASKRVAADLTPYSPRYGLWSDGADKQRWLRLPPGAHIDSSDSDHFRFPVGAMLFKEFAREGKRLETRLIARLGEANSDTFFGTFVWLDDESDALLTPDGSEHVRGTDHAAPSALECIKCHQGEPGNVLGLSALQVPALPATLLSHPVPPYRIPGDAVSELALGTLHANCGHCHNVRGIAWRETSMTLRVSVRELGAGKTELERSTVGAALESFAGAPGALRVAPGQPGESALLQRMLVRGDAGLQMPPIATRHVDVMGSARVSAWITSLTQPSQRADP